MTAFARGPQTTRSLDASSMPIRCALICQSDQRTRRERARAMVATGFESRVRRLSLLRDK